MRPGISALNTITLSALREMTNYRQSKLFFGLPSRDMKRWHEDRDAVLVDYPRSDDMKGAVFSNVISAMRLITKGLNRNWKKP